MTLNGIRQRYRHAGGQAGPAADFPASHRLVARPQGDDVLFAAGPAESMLVCEVSREAWSAKFFRTRLPGGIGDYRPRTC